MTLVFHNRDRNPATHALVMGVGRYPFLKGGSHPAPKVSRWGLGQVSSPPGSAKAIANFLVGELDNPGAPLGSVELLLSPSGPYALPDGSASHDVEAATMANIERAAKEWKARCDRRPDNVALFFFCGHGVSRRHLTLLAEDFGDPTHARVFKNSFNLEKTAEGMGSDCKARVQCFFADACRSVPKSAAMQIDSVGLFSIMNNLRRPRDAPIFYSTLPKDPAYGDTDGVTPYTQAVLSGFRGTGSVYQNGRWRVTTGRLAEAIASAMAAEAELGGGLGTAGQRPVGGGQGGAVSVLHTISVKPRIPVRIYLQPKRASKQAHLSITSKTPPGKTENRGPDGCVWHLLLDWGEYEGNATFPSESPPLRGGPRDLYVSTPETTDIWEL